MDKSHAGFGRYGPVGFLALLALAGLALCGRGPALLSGAAGDSLRFGLAGFVDGAAFGDLVRADHGAASIIALWLGLIAGTSLGFLVGRWLVKPLLQLTASRRPPAPDPLPPPGLLAQIAAFMTPPPPPRRPGEPPFLVQYGFAIAAVTHLLPPPGPWWLRLVLPVVLGSSDMPFARFVGGAATGWALHLIVLWMAHQAGIILPGSPTGWVALLVLALPMIVTVAVRSVLALRTALRRRVVQ